jgi:hypothetical protein
MAFYGQVIDEYTTINENIYILFTNYFGNPLMTKIKNEEINKLSMYVCKAYCLLSKECRYIIVFVEMDANPIKHVINLKHLSWKSLQTRTLSDQQFNIKSHGYTPAAVGPLTCVIERINITKEASTYKCDEFPLIITLLHTEKKTSEVYQNKGTIIAALETWETIITFKV